MVLASDDVTYVRGMMLAELHGSGPGATPAHIRLLQQAASARLNAEMRALTSGSSSAYYHEHADEPHAVALLRERCERRRCRAAEYG
jgi:hypothetical protein